MKLRVMAGLTACLLLGAHAWAAISILDNVTATAQNNWTFNRYWGGSPGSITPSFLASSPNNFDSQSYTLQLDYSLPPAAGGGGYLYFGEQLTSNGSDTSLAAYNYLSFWVKGAAGGEGFQVGLMDSSFNSGRVQVNNFLPSGITTQWQKVVIPFSALEAGVANGANISRAAVNKLEFDFANNGTNEYNRMFGAESGTVYIDNLTFGTSAAPVWVCNYNGCVAPDSTTHSAQRGTILGIGPAGTAAYSSLTFTSAPLSMAFSFGATVRNLVHYLYRDSIAARSAGNCTDFSGCTDLQFDIKGATGGENPAVRLVDLNFGPSVLLGTVTTVTTQFQTLTIPLSMFYTLAPGFLPNQGVELDFDATASLPASTVYLDNVRFVDTLVPAAPTNMTFQGLPVSDGFHTLYTLPAGSLTVNALAISSDSKMESVSFEYSHDGGVTWNLIAYDYAVTNGQTSFSGIWDFSALPNGPYQLRAKANHVGGTFSALTYNIVLNYGTPTVSPTFTQTSTATPTFTASPTVTFSPTLTSTPSITETFTASPTNTNSPTVTPTASISATATQSGTFTRTATVTATPSASATPTPSPSSTISPTLTRTPTITVSPTATTFVSATCTLTPTVTLTPFARELLVGRNSFNNLAGEVLPLEARLPDRGKLLIVIYSRLGEKIMELSNQDAGPGIIKLNWDGKNSNGQAVASGVYVIFTELGNKSSKHLVAVIH